MPIKTVFVAENEDELSVEDGYVYLNGREFVDTHELLEFLQWELAKAEPEPVKADDGWIEWKGGEMPALDRLTLVTVRFRNVSGHNEGRVCEWDWRHCGWDFDIIAYRVCEPAKTEPAEIDLSNNRVPFGLLSPEEQQALRDAHEAGRVIEFWVSPGMGWLEKKQPGFAWESVYRIKENTNA